VTDHQSTITTEQKILALKAIAELSFQMRAPGDWFTNWKGVEIGGDGMLRSVSGNGADPFQAAEDLWKQATTLTAGQYLVTSAYGGGRKQHRWHDFMWHEIPISSETKLRLAEV
jgi:hypothetical protein